MADGARGHVLTIDGEIYRNDEEKEIYTIYNSLEAARSFIKEK
jgi:hypothetical protein